MDAINHPKHYVEGRKYEPADVIDDWQLDFVLGNAVKYISRAGRKGNTLEDLEKAKWYLQRRIDKEREKTAPKEEPTASLPDVGFSYRPDEHKVIFCSDIKDFKLVSKADPAQSLADAPQCPCACCQRVSE